MSPEITVSGQPPVKLSIEEAEQVGNILLNERHRRIMAAIDHSSSKEIVKIIKGNKPLVKLAEVFKKAAESEKATEAGMDRDF